MYTKIRLDRLAKPTKSYKKAGNSTGIRIVYKTLYTLCSILQWKISDRHTFLQVCNSVITFVIRRWPHVPYGEGSAVGVAYISFPSQSLWHQSFTSVVAGVYYRRDQLIPYDISKLGQEGFIWGAACMIGLNTKESFENIPHRASSPPPLMTNERSQWPMTNHGPQFRKATLVFRFKIKINQVW
jgi:hypothetical protein